VFNEGYIFYINSSVGGKIYNIGITGEGKTLLLDDKAADLIITEG
jgi:hypothetical protein